MVASLPPLYNRDANGKYPSSLLLNLESTLQLSNPNSIHSAPMRQSTQLHMKSHCYEEKRDEGHQLINMKTRRYSASQQCVHYLNSSHCRLLV